MLIEHLYGNGDCMPLYGGHLDGPVQLKDMLRKGLETKPEEPALVSLETRWTWRKLTFAKKKEV